MNITTLSQAFAGLNLPTQLPTSSTSLVEPLSGLALSFAEMPLTQLIELSPETMTDEERKAYVVRLRELRKAPQTLNAAVNAEQMHLTNLHGSGPAEQIRRKVGGGGGVSKANAAAKGQALANKYLDL